MNDLYIFKMSDGDIKSLYKELGSNEANIANILGNLEELKKLIKQLQEDIFKLKVSAEVTKVKLMTYGSLGGVAYSIGIYFFKFLISKMGVVNG